MNDDDYYLRGEKSEWKAVNKKPNALDLEIAECKRLLEENMIPADIKAELTCSHTFIESDRFAHAIQCSSCKVLKEHPQIFELKHGKPFDPGTELPPADIYD